MERLKTVLTIEQVRNAVEDIRASAGDYEIAHSLEDDLHALVLEAVRDGASDAAELARAALETREIDFPRHCA